MAKLQIGKTVCLITPGHISSNPRLVKEATALSQSGYKVHLVFTQYVNYLVDHDRKLLNANPSWTYDCLNWTGYNLASKINRFWGKMVQLFNSDSAIKLNRNYLWQLKKAIAFKADLYIAHNLSALPIAVIAAKKNNAKCGFDAEDFHRNEVSNDLLNEDVMIKTAVEEKYIPQVDYMTASSPQITLAYKTLFNREIVTVLNVFSKIEPFNIINNTSKSLQLFWFSQTIGPNRGLETVTEAIKISGLKIDLHLLGKSDSDFNQTIMNSVTENSWQVYFHDPVFADDIFKLAKSFDLGLAAEPTKPLNRNICLTNKLFTYLQSGLAVILSNTSAQTAFLQQFPEVGLLYNNADELATILTRYHNNRELLYTTKIHNYHLGQNTLNWGIESQKFISLIQNTVN